TELAAELHRRFGGAVEITIASFKYPLEPGAQRREPPGGVVSTAELPGVTLSVELENDVAPSGGLFRGLAWARNSGPTTVQLHTAREIGGYILDEAGRALAGYFGFTFAAGRTLVIQPGQRKSVPFFVGMDSYDPRIGTVLPPGDFELVVVLPLGGRPREQLVSRPTRVTVTPAAT
ncbi:MAG: hypothetical protein JWO63_1934, partial [Frankiales bacterium]|nr:hypothetical protein [Frankiales bacterium]